MRPFSNGTEYGYWLDKNCERCKKNVEYTDNEEYITHCDIEEALAIGTITGDVPDEIYKRMGNPLDFNCPEFENKDK